MTLDDADQRREAIHDFIQRQGPGLDIGDGSLLTGWVMVLEWADPDGERWLSKGYAATTTRWCADGMLHEALYGDWPDEGDEEEEG